MKKIMLFMAVLATFVSCEMNNCKVQVDSKQSLNPYDSTFDYHIKYKALSMNARGKIYLAHLSDIDHPIDSAQTSLLSVVEMNGNVSREGIYCLFARNRANRDEIQVKGYLYMHQKYNPGENSFNIGNNYINYKTIADIDSSSIVLDGVFEGAPKGTAYLIDYNDKIVDSLISDDGSFTFRNNIDATKAYLVEYSVHNSYNNTNDESKYFFQPSYKMKNGAKVGFNQVKHIWVHPVVECQQLTDSTVHYVIDGRADYLGEKEIYLVIKGDKHYSVSSRPTKDEAEAVCKVVDGKYHFEGVAPVRGVQLYGKKYYRYIWFDDWDNINGGWVSPTFESLTDSTLHYVFDGKTGRGEKEIYLSINSDGSTNKDEAVAVCKVVDQKFHFEGEAKKGLLFQLYGDKYYKNILVFKDCKGCRISDDRNDSTINQWVKSKVK